AGVLPALAGAVIHDASTLLLNLPGLSISRYKEPNKKQVVYQSIALSEDTGSWAGMTMIFGTTKHLSSRKGRSTYPGSPSCNYRV
ncbi:MAG: hypothetical protein ACPF9E_17570, partial [Alteromonas oceani]